MALKKININNRAYFGIPNASSHKDQYWFSNCFSSTLSAGTLRASPALYTPQKVTMRSNDTLARLPRKKKMPVSKIRAQQASPRGPWAISRENVHNAPQAERRRGLRALQILPAVEEDAQEPRDWSRTSANACSYVSSSRGGDSEPVCRLKR